MAINISQNRYQELRELWWDESSDPETQEWRDDLTASEEKLVASWDHSYNLGVKSLCQQILEVEARLAARWHTPTLEG